MELKQIEQLPATDQAHTLQKILGIFKNKKIYFSQMRNCIVKIGKYVPILTKKYFSKNIYFFNFQDFFSESFLLIFSSVSVLIIQDIIKSTFITQI